MRKWGMICILLGTVLVLGALSLSLYNRGEAERAGEAAEIVLPQLIEKIARSEQTSSTDFTEGTSYPDPYDPAMTEVEIEGYGYVGYLSIAALEVDLPVMSKWDYTRLKIAPCRYSGSAKTDNLVICAHNYVHHFGYLSTLSEGDEIIFTDMDGVAWIYTVAAVDLLSADAVEEMESGEYDLTLFTCTYDGGSRVTVRCDRVKPS